MWLLHASQRSVSWLTTGDCEEALKRGHSRDPLLSLSLSRFFLSLSLSLSLSSMHVMTARLKRPKGQRRRLTQEQWERMKEWRTGKVRQEAQSVT